MSASDRERVRRPRGLAACIGAGGVLIALLFAVSVARPSAQSAPGRMAQRAPSGPPRSIAFRVTPVAGESWLNHLRISFDTTSMGRMGQNTPPPALRYEPKWNQLAGAEDLNERFILSGSDLYRLDCESCHQPDGRGSPPEIHSLIEPIQATSAAALEERMKRAGRPITAAMAREMAAGGEAAVRNRLLHGGEKMPPFEHLQGDEVEALLAFLRELAGVPGAESQQIRVAEPYTRVGEHLVKGTCHICHSSTGPGTNPQALLRNVLPSLASFPREKTFVQVMQKVRQGTPIAEGPVNQLSGGRMPVFSYLTDDEVAAAYLYLIIYPPRQ